MGFGESGAGAGGGGAIVGVEARVEGDVGEEVDAFDQLTGGVRADGSGARFAQRHARADGEGVGVGDVGKGDGRTFVHNRDDRLPYCRNDSLGGSAVLVVFQLQSRKPRDAWQSGRSSRSTRHCLDANTVHHVLERVEALAIANASRVPEYPLWIDLILKVNSSDRGRSASDNTGRLLSDRLVTTGVAVRGTMSDNDVVDHWVVESHALALLIFLVTHRTFRLVEESLGDFRRRRSLVDGKAHVGISVRRQRDLACRHALVDREAHVGASVGGSCETNARRAGTLHGMLDH